MSHGHADFVPSMTSIFVCRFILNLRQRYYMGPAPSLATISEASMPEANSGNSHKILSSRILGNIGASMQDTDHFSSVVFASADEAPYDGLENVYNDNMHASPINDEVNGGTESIQENIELTSVNYP